MGLLFMLFDQFGDFFAFPHSCSSYTFSYLSNCERAILCGGPKSGMISTDLSFLPFFVTDNPDKSPSHPVSSEQSDYETWMEDL